MSLMFFIWVSVATIVPCDLGDKLSSALWEVNYLMDQNHWYLYPIEILKVLPIVLRGVQEPAYIECFGSFKCNRESFKKVRMENLTFYYYYTRSKSTTSFPHYSFFPRYPVLHFRTLTYFVLSESEPLIFVMMRPRDRIQSICLFKVLEKYTGQMYTS